MRGFALWRDGGGRGANRRDWDSVMLKGEVAVFALRRSVCYITENRDRKQL